MAKTFTREQIRKFPPYVKASGVALRLHNPEQGNFGWRENHVEYYRDAGFWSVDINIVGDKLWTIAEGDKINNIELIPITKQEWRKDNRGYITKTTKAYKV